MRIGIVGEQWVTGRPGGMNRYVAGLHAGLVALGADVTTFCLARHGERLPPGVVSVASPSDSPVRRLRAFRRALRAHGPFDVVDDQFAPYAARGIGGTPAPLRVVHFHGPWAAESEFEGATGLKVRQRRLIERAVYRNATRYICDSTAFADVLRDTYGVPSGSICSINPGLDLDLWSPGDRSAERRRLGLPGEAFVVVTVRRLVPRMGHRVLIDAWSTVLERHPDAVLAIIGEGPLAEELQSLADDLDGDVRLTGRVPDEELRQWYVASDLQVVPTLAWEGFGLVVLEALGCGRPSLVTDVGGLPQLPRRLDERLVVAGGNPAELAGRLEAFADGTVGLPDQTSCRSLAEEHSWERVARRHLELYAEMLEDGP